jgi:Ca-activated chloride channel family protein
MLAEDVTPNRLDHAIRETRRLMQDARGDRLALLAFAGRSYILTPLTLDAGAVRLQLDALDPDIASEGGTDLAAVLRQGTQLLDAASEGGSRAMVVFTDGEAHDSLAGALAAARELRAAGATLIVVGVGGSTPVRIPVRAPDGTLQEYKRDQQGAEVLTARRDDVLRAVADAGEGILVPAEFPDQAGAVWRTVAGLERAAASSQRTEDLIPRAWMFALLGAALLALQAATRRTAALLTVALALLPAGPAASQRPADAEQRLRMGDSLQALARYMRAATAAKSADTSWYNAGTTALLVGSDSVATHALNAGARSLDPALRFRALYNLGLQALERSRADTTGRREREQEAARYFRDALLLDPGSRAAKWNLELVSSRTPPSSGGGGGGGSGGSPAQPQELPPDPGGDGMSRVEAEQILSSVERAESDVRADQLRRRRVARSAAAKDW